MQNATQLITIVIVVILVILLDLRSRREQDTLRDIISRQQQVHKDQLTEQRMAMESGFTRAVAAVSDATAKAVQSITYPETLSSPVQVPNSQLPAVREMPVRERVLDLDYTDPTDETMPEVVLRPDVGVLGDDVNGPLGIPGLHVDPARYG